MKKLFLFFFSINITVGFSQSASSILDIIVNGQGKTKQEAQSFALRSAIEQAFGTFISSKTEIINDNLVKDEIVSLSNGNVQKFDIIDEINLPDGSYSITLKAVVSVTKLINFCESKGINVEFKGGVFAMNVLMQELYEKSEKVAWLNTKKAIYEIMAKGFDYRLDVKSPVLHHGSIYNIPIDIYIDINKNYENALSLLKSFCKSASLNELNVKEYLNLGKQVYPIIFPSRPITVRETVKGDLNKDVKIAPSFLRNEDVANEIISIPWELARIATYNFKIDNGIKSFFINQIKNKVYVEDANSFENAGTSMKEINSQLQQSAAYILCRGMNYRLRLFGWSNPAGGAGNMSGGDISESGLAKYDWGKNYKFFSVDYISGYMSQKPNPLEELPIFNFINPNKFLKIHFDYQMDLDEIRRITEFKVVLDSF